ncbi:MAG: outer membrane lipoprotein Blc [Bacteroidetes bacterium]|jgi:apolipoprotein D and lipocalin family protein|nr:MAG: outer membrane lipoprotein Blc [Bacteroidota bacterium]
MKYSKVLIAGIILVLSGSIMSSCSGSFRRKMMTEIKTVELNRFLGTWYEIARFPHRFERGLTGVTATYKLRDDGMIEVINKGYMNSLDGEEKIAVGKAKVASKDGKGHLKVSFFWIFYADYFILELDQQDYSYALIGSSSDTYLWILSRKPEMEKATLDMLLKRAEELGYDLSKVEFVQQKTMNN